MFKPLVMGAVIGIALTALLLTDSSRVAARIARPNLPQAVEAVQSRARSLYRERKYSESRSLFLNASAEAHKLGLATAESDNLRQAGLCLYLISNFRGAAKDFERALDIARASRSLLETAAAENALADLYTHMGHYERALRMAEGALSGPEGGVSRTAHAYLLHKKALALAELKRFPEAEPFYKEAVEEFIAESQLDAAARIEGELGKRYMDTGRLDEAETMLSDALWVVRIHRINASANILSNLAQLKAERGDMRSAGALFDAAVGAPPGITPMWSVGSSRGRFRLRTGDLKGALGDFREARRLALEMRADIVPADQDRIALESGFSPILSGLVDAGNRLAINTGDRSLFQESFDAAEQDRMWSLRALVPSPDDWRTRLPDRYWELLSQYQSLMQTGAVRSPEISRKVSSLNEEMQRLEAASAGQSRGTTIAESALLHVRGVIGEGSVLFSFLIGKSSAWVWVLDGRRVNVYQLPPPSQISADVGVFTRSLRAGKFDAARARKIFADLFGSVPENFLGKKQWLIEPDGPLNDLPFAALIPSGKQSDTQRPTFLVERAALQIIPGSLLLERGEIRMDGSFLGVGDAIYNAADARYVGKASPEGALPRLPNTAAELGSCARALGSSAPVLLTGTQANPASVAAALSARSSIVHFATHVITEPGEFHSGLIALSLDHSGMLGLLGSKEILARSVGASLIVMNGCHSAQGESLAATGLMGLTRAWIGAGAKAVISTRWDIPDEAANSLITDFYRALRSEPGRRASFALREAQLRAIQRDNGRSMDWAAYSLLSRLI